MKKLYDAIACIGLLMYAGWLLSVILGVPFLGSLLVVTCGVVSLIGCTYFSKCSA